MGKANPVEHTILTDPGSVLIRQPPRRLGSEKNSEVEEQVEGLLEPGGGV